MCVQAYHSPYYKETHKACLGSEREVKAHSVSGLACQAGVELGLYARVAWFELGLPGVVALWRSTFCPS